MVRDCLKVTKAITNAPGEKSNNQTGSCCCPVQCLIFALAHTRIFEQFYSIRHDSTDNRTVIIELLKVVSEDTKHSTLFCPKKIGLQVQKILKEIDSNRIQDIDRLVPLLFGKILELKPFISHNEGKTKLRFFHLLDVDKYWRLGERFVNLQKLFMESIVKKKFVRVPHPALFIKVPRCCGRSKIVPNLTLNVTSSIQAGPIATYVHLYAVICLSNKHYTVFVRISKFDWLYFDPKKEHVEWLDREFSNHLYTLEKFACTNGMKSLSPKIYHVVSNIDTAIYLPENSEEHLSNYRMV